MLPRTERIPGQRWRRKPAAIDAADPNSGLRLGAALRSATARMRSIVESGEDFIIWTETADRAVTGANRNFAVWLGGRRSRGRICREVGRLLGDLVTPGQEVETDSISR